MSQSTEIGSNDTNWVEKLRIRYVLATVLVVLLVSATMWTHHQQHITLDQEFYGKTKAFETDSAAQEILNLYRRTVDDIEGLQNRVFWLLVLTIVVVLASFLLIFEPVARLIDRAMRQREEALRLAREASEHKSRFLANMSHEIRTPMNGIVGMGELLSSTQLEPEQRDCLSMMRQSADSLLNLLNDILDFSKIEAGKLEFELSPFQLRDCVESTTQTYSAKAAEKCVELACRIDPAIPDTLIGDAGRLRQVIANLVSNAVKFTEHGEVVVDIARVPATSDSEVKAPCVLRCRVTDTGIGIPLETQSDIFDAFSQADASTTRRFGGTGLGLAISTQLVEMMNGKIDVESQVGQGTTFSFTAEFVVASKQMKPSERLSRAPKLKALVVDDNETSRNILIDTLTDWGIDTLAAESGAAGLELVRQHADADPPIRLVLVDHLMPQMDGFQFAERLRELGSADQCSTILVSTLIRAGDADRCRELNIARCLPKPVKSSELLNTIVGFFDPDSQPGTVAAEPKPTAQPRKILLVEDNPINQRVAIGFLEPRGHHVEIADDGVKAVDAVSRDSFDLVLMDIHLPKMDGYQATEAIRELKSSQDLPILAMTANAMKGDRERCLELGMDGYISKPIDRAELLFLVESVPVSTSPGREASKPANEPTNTEKASGGSDTAGHLISWERAVERIPGGVEVVRDLAGMLQTQAPQLLSEIIAANQQQDSTNMRRAAHTLKGSLAIFEAAPMVEIANRLESIAKSGEFDQANAWLDKLGSMMPRLQEELSTFLQSTESTV